MTLKKSGYFLLILVGLIVLGTYLFKNFNLNPSYEIGQKIDSLNGVSVYYNGGVSHVGERTTARNGYNLGLKFQCVEFVKRYYYERLGHQMPDPFGNAEDFFDPKVEDGRTNKLRGLWQFTNPSPAKPQESDLLVYSASFFNKYGHVAIVSEVFEDEIEIVQQNPGPFGASRERYSLTQENGVWKIGNTRILGWLRK